MRTPILLIALCVLPTAPETFDEATVDKKLSTIYERLGTGHGLTVEEELDVLSDQVEGVLELNPSAWLELNQQVETLRNATAQLLGVLSIVRSRQAASSAVQASQVILLLGYFITILVIFCVKHCKKVSERQRQREFERLEMQLRSSKAKRRAAAAKEKSAQAQDLE